MRKGKIKFLLKALILAAILLTGCKKNPEKGVSFKLASDRKMLVKDIEYSLHFSVPAGKSGSITGKNEISFTAVKKEEVVIDFREDGKNVQKVTIDNNAG